MKEKNKTRKMKKTKLIALPPSFNDVSKHKIKDSDLMSIIFWFFSIYLVNKIKEFILSLPSLKELDDYLNSSFLIFGRKAKVKNTLIYFSFLVLISFMFLNFLSQQANAAYSCTYGAGCAYSGNCDTYGNDATCGECSTGGGTWISTGSGGTSKCCGDDNGEDWEGSGSGNSCCYNNAAMADGAVVSNMLCSNGLLFDCGGAETDDGGLGTHVTAGSCTAYEGKYCQTTSWASTKANGCTCAVDGDCTSNLCDNEAGGAGGDNLVCYSATNCGWGTNACGSHDSDCQIGAGSDTGCDDYSPNGCAASAGYCSTACVYDTDGDTSSTVCACLGDSWIASQGSVTGSNYYCCGDDSTSDDYSTYSGSLTTSTSVTCDSCFNGADQGATTLYGNGYTSGSRTGDTSLTCYYSTITCSSTARSNSASGTYCGNGFFSSSNTLCTAASKTVDTSGYCYYADITCADESASNSLVSALLYGNGILLDAPDTCYYGDITCGDGSASDGASESCEDEGVVSGNVCYYDEGCSDTGANTGCNTGETHPSCDEGDMTDSNANCGQYDYSASNDRCYYSASDACLADDDGWDYATDTTLDSVTVTGFAEDYQYDDATDKCYYNIACGTSGFTASEDTCYDSGTVVGTTCYYTEACTAAGAGAGCETGDSAPASCDSGSFADGAMACGVYSSDVCYYHATDACAADADGWDHNSYDCESSDDTSLGDSLLTEAELNTTSCTSACTGADCCEIQTITCGAGYECLGFHDLIDNEDETSNATCYYTNAAAWEWGASAESAESGSACSDGYDNDCDGLTDTADDDCDYVVDDDNAGVDTTRDTGWDYWAADADAICNDGGIGDYGDLCEEVGWSGARGFCAAGGTLGTCYDGNSYFVIDDESTYDGTIWDSSSVAYTSNPASDQDGQFCTGYPVTGIDIPTFCADQDVASGGWAYTTYADCASATDKDSDTWTDEFFKWDESEGDCVECDPTTGQQATAGFDLTEASKTGVVCESGCGANSGCDERDINEDWVSSETCHWCDGVCSDNTDTTVGSTSCTTCSSGYQMADSEDLCYYSITCDNSWIDSTSDTCLDEGVVSASKCYYDEGCSGSGANAGCTSGASAPYSCDFGDFADGAGYCYNDANNACYYDNTDLCAADDDGWDYSTANCYDPGYRSGASCYYDNGGSVDESNSCSNTGCTGISSDSAPTCDEGSYSDTDANCGDWDYSSTTDACYHDTTDPCDADFDGWDWTLDTDYDGVTVIGANSGTDYQYNDAGDKCYYSFSCETTGWSATSVACYDPGYESGNDCYYDNGGSVDEADSCSGTGCSGISSETHPTCDEGDMSGSNANCGQYDYSASNDRCLYSATDACAVDFDGWDYSTDTDYDGQTITGFAEDYQYYDAGDKCYYDIACATTGFTASTDTCYDSGTVSGTTCYYNEGCSASGANAGCETGEASPSSCDSGSFADGAMAGGVYSSDVCYYHATDACAADADGWDHNSYDCESSDDTSLGDTILTEAEINATSCTSACTGANCCEIQTVTCSGTYECLGFHDLIDNEDETSNATCYYTNAGAWNWAASAETTETNCIDGYDNDCDGDIDAVDSDCVCSTGDDCSGSEVCVNALCRASCDYDASYGSLAGYGCSTGGTAYSSSGTCYDSSPGGSGGVYGCDESGAIRVDCGDGSCEAVPFSSDSSYNTCDTTSGHACDTIGGDYSQTGTCASGAANNCDTSGEVAKNSSIYYQTCAADYECDSDATSGGNYTRDGFCAGTSCATTELAADTDGTECGALSGCSSPSIIDGDEDFQCDTTNEGVVCASDPTSGNPPTLDGVCVENLCDTDRVAVNCGDTCDSTDLTDAKMLASCSGSTQDGWACIDGAPGSNGFDPAGMCISDINSCDEDGITAYNSSNSKYLDDCADGLECSTNHGTGSYIRSGYCVGSSCEETLIVVSSATATSDAECGTGTTGCSAPGWGDGDETNSCTTTNEAQICDTSPETGPSGNGACIENSCVTSGIVRINCGTDGCTNADLSDANIVTTCDASSGDSCDSSLDGNGISQDGICASSTCETSNFVCFASSTYYSYANRASCSEGDTCDESFTDGDFSAGAKRYDPDDNVCDDCTSEVGEDGTCEEACGADVGTDEKTISACDGTSGYINATCGFISDGDYNSTVCGCVVDQTGGDAGKEWDIGGDFSNCCGDDAGEYDFDSDFNETIDITPSITDACCDASTDCVYSNTCYATGYVSGDIDGDGDNDYCESGTWFDCSNDGQCAAGYTCESNDCEDTIAPTCTISGLSEDTNSGYQYVSSTTIFYNTLGTGQFTVTVDSTDDGSGVHNVTFPTTVSSGSADTTSAYTQQYTWATDDTYSTNATITCYDVIGNSAIDTLNITLDTTSPTSGSISYTDGYYVSENVPITYSIGSDSQSGLNTSTGNILRRSATLDAGSCGSYGSWGTIITESDGSYADTTVATGNCYQYRYEIFDNVLNGVNFTSANTAKVTTEVPNCSIDVLFEDTNLGYQYISGNEIFYNTETTGQFSVNVSANASLTGINNVTFPTTVSAGVADTSSEYKHQYTWATDDTYSTTATVTCYANSGNSADDTFDITRDITAPSGGSIVYPDSYNDTVSITFSDGTDSGAGLNISASRLLAQSATIQDDNTCGSYSSWWQENGLNPSSPYTDSLTAGKCYKYRYENYDNVMNDINYTSSNRLKYNNIPTHATPTISPGSPNQASNLTCNWISVSDSDSHSVRNITNWYKNNVSTTVLYMPFEGNENEANNASDYSGYGNNGTVLGAIFNRTGGKIGGAYEFDSTTDRIEVPMSAINGTIGTIEFWYRETGSETATAHFFGSSQGNYYFDLSRDNADDVINFQLDNSAASEWSGVPSVFDGSWHHISVTWETNLDSYFLYIDGNSQGEQTNGRTFNTGYNLLIGNRGGLDRNIAGYLDEFKVYDIILSSDQIYQNFLAGSQGRNSQVLIYNETTYGDEWHCSVTVNDGYQDGSNLNSSSVIIGNAAPEKVILLDPSDTNSSLITNPTTLIWDNITNAEGDPLEFSLNLTSDTCPDYGHITSLTNLNYTPTSELELDCTYNWSVRAYDGIDYGPWSDVWSFTIPPTLILTLVNNTINFGEMATGQSLDTDTIGGPFVVRNDGNVFANITWISINESIFTTVDGNTEYFMYKIDETASEPNSFNLSNSTNTWTNLTLISEENRTAIGFLNYSDSNDEAEIDINVTVPIEEPPGNRKVTLYIIGEES